MVDHFVLVGLFIYIAAVFCSLQPNIFDWEIGSRIIFLTTWLGLYVIIYLQPYRKWHLPIYNYFNCQ